MSRYKWVHPVNYIDNWETRRSSRLLDVGILNDGTLWNPNGYPDDIVRAAVTAADTKRHERASEAAKKASVTRQRRQEKKTLEAARRILAGHGIGARHSCAICGRSLDDPASIERGVGSECWQDLLAVVERLKPR